MDREARETYSREYSLRDLINTNIVGVRLVNAETLELEVDEDSGRTTWRITTVAYDEGDDHRLVIDRFSEERVTEVKVVERRITD